MVIHAWIQKVLQEGSNSDRFYFFFFFLGGGGLVDEGREDPNTTKSWPSSARQLNVIEMDVSLAGG